MTAAKLLLLCCAALPGAAQKIELVAVQEKAVERKLKLPGELLPYETVDLRARAGGFVEKVLVDRGSRVKKGQLLAVLSAPELSAQRAEAEMRVKVATAQRAEAAARLAAAQASRDRLRTAAATPGAIAGNELVQAEKLVDAAQAQVQAQESNIQAAQAGVAAVQVAQDYLEVRAPFSGVVTERLVHPGALASAASAEPLLRLQQVDRLRLVVAVPEANTGRIPLGTHVTFTVPAFPGQEWPATVARLARTVDVKTRSMPVELDVRNSTDKLAPGMYSEVNWSVRGGPAVLLVPPTAVVTTTERTFVVRARQGAAEYVRVSRGPLAGELVEVRGALKAGDQVVKRATDEIREGARLTQ